KRVEAAVEILFDDRGGLRVDVEAAAEARVLFENCTYGRGVEVEQLHDLDRRLSFVEKAKDLAGDAARVHVRRAADVLDELGANRLDLRRAERVHAILVDDRGERPLFHAPDRRYRP